MGGVRTALYNYLFARRHGGKFIIRIEDTDSQRFVPGAEQYILDSLAWCGIEIDEGIGAGDGITIASQGPHAPYRQSERRDIYVKYALQLVESGWAYYAFDSAGALDVIADTVAAGALPQAARKWWLTELARRANDAGVELEAVGMTPTQVAQLQELMDAGTLNDALAKKVIDGVLAGEGDPAAVAQARGLTIVSDDGALEEAVDRAIAANADAAQKIRDGKAQAIGALMGAVMREMKGKADAGRVRELINARLGVAG